MWEIFKIGFISIRVIDIVDIALVSFIFYQLYKIMRGSAAIQIFIGLLAVLGLSFIAQLTGMRTLTWLLKLITDIWVIAFIIIFQPEIRRFLMMISKNKILMFLRGETVEKAVNVSEELAEAAFELSQHQHGALIVLVRVNELKNIIETGMLLNAKLSKDLLRNIFFPRSPLHDGAVVVRGDTIVAARCTLPLSNTMEVDGVALGMRHRAALGITETTDALALVVSEETGGISVAEDGKLTQGLSKESLKKLLNDKLNLQTESNWRTFFGQHKK
jgi:diadenylate cyclase